MSFLRQYIREHVRTPLTFALSAGIFAVTFLMYHLPIAAVLYPAVLCALTGLVVSGASAYRAYRKHKRLVEAESLSALSVLHALDALPGIDDGDYRRIIAHLCREKQEAERKFQAAYSDMVDYYTVWVHQIKTPIASMRLHLSAEDTALSRTLASDLLHIEQYVEMVLTYLRMGSDTTDYVFREAALDTLIKDNIRRLRGDFITKRLNLQYAPSGETVITDEKWLSFVVGQILSNALKYTREGGVTVTVEPPKTLCISDTGIGITPEDIPRIFEKGFTGRHGREHSHASGLGLYLCKEICDRLGIGLAVTSEIGRGTAVRLDLDQGHHARALQNC